MRHAYRFWTRLVLAAGCIFIGVLLLMSGLSIVPGFFAQPPTVAVSGTVETTNFTMSCAPGVLLAAPDHPLPDCAGIAVRLATSANSDAYTVGQVYNFPLRDGTHPARGNTYSGSWTVANQPDILTSLWKNLLGVILVMAGVAVLRIARHHLARQIRPEHDR